MQKSETTNQDGVKKCEGCKHAVEHLSTVLPFSVLEKMADKPLRIRGIAMTTGMSRNLNIYTSEELQAFTSKLVSAPVYIEHIAVPNAVGKVTKTDWDGHNLWYEAEIYDDQTAEKIRKGLVQHVSVGADYEAIDVVDGKVPHGLHNAELSLVAVPGIPETNVQVLEKLVDAKFTEVLKKAGDQENLQGKLSETEGKLTESGNKLTEAQKTIEDLRKQLPGGFLLKNPPAMMPVSEHIAVLEGLLPPVMVERSSMGMQRQGQAVRSAIFKAKERLVGGP